MFRQGAEVAALTVWSIGSGLFVLRSCGSEGASAPDSMPLFAASVAMGVVAAGFFMWAELEPKQVRGAPRGACRAGFRVVRAARVRGFAAWARGRRVDIAAEKVSKPQRTCEALYFVCMCVNTLCGDVSSQWDLLSCEHG